MVAPGIFKRKETEFEVESRLFDEQEALVNADVLKTALAAQAAERARLARLRGEVASPGGSEGNVVGPSDKAGDVAGPIKMRGNVVGVADPSPAEFLKSWKKIGSVKENLEWNKMVREVRSSISRPFLLF
jgi:hypothetical protein